MGADREPVRVRDRTWALVVTVGAAAALGLILGRTTTGTLAVALTVVAAGLLTSLGYARAPEADSATARNMWLLLFFCGETLFMGTFWIAAGAVLDGSEQIDVLTALPFGLIAAATYTWGLWQEATDQKVSLRLPRFGIAADRHSERQREDGDPNPNRPR